MKRRVAAVVLILGIVFGMMPGGNAVYAAETGGALLPDGKKIIRIEVVDTDVEIPYKSAFTKDNIAIKVIYNDKSEVLTHPDRDITLDTSKLGDHTFDVYYQNVKTEYTIRVVPRKVTGLKLKEATKKKAVIEWNSLTEAKVYEIYTSAKEASNYTLLKSTKETNFEFTELKAGQLVYVKIRALSGEYAGEESAVLVVALQPDIVTEIVAVKNVKTKITLTWKDVAGATGYQIYYRRENDKDGVLAGTTEQNTFQVTGLSSGTNYYFTLIAYAGDTSNASEPSDEVLYGTAPSIPQITSIKGGTKRVKIKWSKGSGADYYNIYVSTKASSGFEIKAKVPSDEAKVRGIDGLKKKKKYYVRVEAVRTVSGITMNSTSTVRNTTTASTAAKSTGVTAKFFATLKAFKKSAAYKKYKAFRKRVIYSKSYVIPGLKVTNVAGFNATRMVPQSVAFAGDYLLISAYDYSKKQESVIYIMSKKTRKYLTTLVLPHTGHVGGITFDGENVWLTYGKNLQNFKFSHIQAAVLSGKPYYELYRFSSVIPMPETMSYVTYYKDHIWAAAYSETAQKYMYGYTIGDKTGVPSLTYTNRIKMPNRTQGVAFTSSGKMIVSRSCQTNKGRRGFMSRLDTYSPSWDFSQKTIRKNSRKKTVKMPPMNEGIAVCGSYTYVIYESSAFGECRAPMDRVTAFKTSKIS